MSDELRTALAERQAPAEQKSIAELIDRMRPELEKSLGSPEAVAALERHYLTAIRLNPELVACSTESLLAALLLSAQVRLEPGPLGHVYLVPFKGQVVWVLGYAGIVELARRSGVVGALRARVVWEGDFYSYAERDGQEHYELTPAEEDARGDRRLVLVTWQEKAGGKWFRRAVEVPRSRIERAKAASPAAQRNAGPWLTDETVMWAKTGIRAMRPWLPLTPDAGAAFAADDSVAVGLEVDPAGAAQPSLVSPDAPESPSKDA